MSLHQQDLQVVCPFQHRQMLAQKPGEEQSEMYDEVLALLKVAHHVR
jgi:hypothetical protein